MAKKDDEDQPQFRTLGTKSARRDLARDQPKTASDLDGIGTPDPVYQEGPDGPDLEPVRIYDGVDPATKEREKQRAEQREAAIEKRKSKKQYTPEEDAADKARYRRDAKRKSIGAKADNFSEALARSASVMRARKAASQTDERGRPEPATGSDSLPEPIPAPKGGLVQTGEIGADGRDIRTPEMRQRQQYNQLRDSYIKRGDRANVNPDGTRMSFRQYMAGEMQARPDSPLAQGLASGEAEQFFSPAKDLADDDYTKEMSRRTQFSNDAKEARRVAMIAARDGGLQAIMEMQNRYDASLAVVQSRMQNGQVGPADFMSLAVTQDSLAGGYTMLDKMYPGRGYDQAAAQQMIAANQNRTYAARIMETATTNQGLVDVAQAGNQQPPTKTNEQEVQAIATDPFRDLAEANAARMLAGDGADAKTSRDSMKTIRAATSLYDAQQAMTVVAQGQAVSPGTPEWEGVSRYAAAVDEQTFVSNLLPLLEDSSLANEPQLRAAKAKRDSNYLMQLYRSARPQRFGIMGHLGNAASNIGGFFYQPSNPPAPTR